MIVFAILITASAGIYIYNQYKNRGRKIPSPKKYSYNKEEATAFVNHIETLGFFKYAALEDLADLRENFINGYDPNNEIVSIWDDEMMVPKDYRYYFCDGEDLFEQDGIHTMLEKLKPTFEKLNFKCNVSNIVEEWDEKNKWINSSLTLNGTFYTIFDKYKGNEGWGLAPLRFAEMLNKELSRQGKEERVYLASGGNDGRLIFLTPDLYTYIYGVYTNNNWKPLEPKEWGRELM